MEELYNEEEINIDEAGSLCCDDSQTVIKEFHHMTNPKRTCRLCLSTNGVMESIFRNQDPDFLKKLMEFTQFEIFEVKSLPTCVCKHCVSIIKNYVELRRKFELVNKMFLTKYGDLITSVKNELQEMSKLEVIPADEELLKVEYLYDDDNPEDLNDDPDYTEVEMKRDPIDTADNDEEDCNGNEEQSETDSVQLKTKRRRKKKKISTKEVMCCVCGIMTTTISQHMITHTGERPFKCTYCSKTFAQMGAVKRHTRLHTGDKPYKCKTCDSCFTNYSTLKTHIVSKHTHERKYHCEFCGKSFGYPFTLSAHRKIHTQERNHRCPHCSKTFLGGNDLKKHIRIHTGEKPYKCEICGKAFTTSGNLNLHGRVHSKDRPFICTICDQGFSYKSVLNTHMKSHSKEEEPMDW